MRAALQKTADDLNAATAAKEAQRLQLVPEPKP